jgi:hypothetical protein
LSLKSVTSASGIPGLDFEDESEKVAKDDSEAAPVIDK